MHKCHGLTLQKSTVKHKTPGKNWSLKRKLGAFKNDFMFWINGNDSKLHFNEWCENNGLKEQKVYTEEVATSKKILPNVNYLKVLYHIFELDIKTEGESRGDD